jgi:hypothetical protein
MWESPFDKACRYLLKLDPLRLLAWLLGLKVGDLAFIRWIDTRRLPYPGQPNRICDTVAHVERLDDDHRPWAFVTEFNIEPDSVMFGRLFTYMGMVWLEEKPSRERRPLRDRGDCHQPHRRRNNVAGFCMAKCGRRIGAESAGT